MAPTTWRPGLERARRWARRRLLYPALAFALPTSCFGCEAPLGPHQHLGACLPCWTSFHHLMPPFCDRCGLPSPPTTDLLGPAGGRCATCLTVRRSADWVRGVLIFDDRARRFLLRAKLGGRRELFEPLAQHLIHAWQITAAADGCSLVVPVPSHPILTIRRGFSPAMELARPLARAAGLPLSARLGVRMLGRQASKRLPARIRLATAESVFRVRGSMKGHRVLLIDDVMTTGASVEACARELKRAGCREVRALIWARKT